MKIIILGAGQVGSTLAENLMREDNDITVVDLEVDRLNALQSRLDIRTVRGQGSHPNVLADAGAEDADMIIAVTNSDEINMIGCQIAYTLFQIPTKIARIRSNNYLAYPTLFQKKYVPIDVCICPEQLITTYVQRLIEYPGTLQVLDFAEGKVQLVAVKLDHAGPFIGKTITDLHQALPKVDMRVAAIYRNDESIPVKKETVIQYNDELFFVAARSYIRAILNIIGQLDNPYRRIIIGGGGNIGTRPAQALENDYSVKLIDHNPKHTELLAEKLNETIVLLGDVSDRELMIDENIECTDIFCAVTNDDEANIMSCMLAKKLGARQVMALITRPAYVDLIESSNIDIAISPQQATIGSILTHIRRGDIVNVHSLRRGAAEAIEVIAHGDERSSKVVGKAIKNIKLPLGATIGAIVRGDKVIIGRGEEIIASDDHIVLFLVDKKHIHDVERLFQVNINYLG